MGSGTVISEGLMDQMIRIIKEGGEIILRPAYRRDGDSQGGQG
ncbi:MAG: hypothetical protein V8S42_09885 [Lachnospiraceae bacterium]